MNIVDLQLSKNYTNYVVSPIGMVKGAPCEVGEITYGEGNVTVELKWEDTEGKKKTTNLIIPTGGSGSLPIATTTVLGGVKVDGETITVTSDGVISGSSTYVLPTASANIKGGVKVGKGLDIVQEVLTREDEVYVGTSAPTNGEEIWIDTSKDYSGSNWGEHYSENETRIGTYCGKPLYRKVVKGTMPSTSSASGSRYSFNIVISGLNIDSCKYDGYIKNNSGVKYDARLSWINTSNMTTSLGTTANVNGNGDFQLFVAGAQSAVATFLSQPYELILEYTKLDE